MTNTPADEAATGRAGRAGRGSAPPGSPRWITTQQAADLLGVRLRDDLRVREPRAADP